MHVVSMVEKSHAQQHSLEAGLILPREEGVT